jgi:hypothetical protein
MLDFNVSLEFNPEIKVTSKNNVDPLVITSCSVHMFPNDDRMYSDFEEQSYNCLNNAVSNLGFVDIEIGFAGYNGTPYPKVFTKCFVLYTDNYQFIKPMKMINNSSESKINHRGETVIGIRYYFRTKDEIDNLLQCNRILFECFFALEKAKNTYAVMCQLEKKDDQWTAKYANTYRPHYATNIKNLID